MVRLKNRRQCPINAFQFRQAETGMAFKDWDFENVVQQVIAHRKQNPRFNLPTDGATVRGEVDHANAMRMLSIRGGDQFTLIEGSNAPDPKRLASRSQFANAVGGVKQLATGGVILAEWLGAGGVPVPGEQANARAGVCAVCPKNEPGDWTRFFSELVAEKIRRQLSIRNDLNLSTPDDDKLRVCGACLCPLKLKVHVPPKHILAHTSEQTKAELDPNCWILKEAANG